MTRADRTMKRLMKGDFEVQEHFPKEIQIAVKSFLEASKMMVEEKLDYLPGEYLANLLETLQKYPEYNNVTMDLVRTILKED
jgi:hypothetical protein|tara:strand:+ start:4702 stop:4947 length:246 start_codon:yes stop_codon:yes gene_type:complete